MREREIGFRLFRNIGETEIASISKAVDTRVKYFVAKRAVNIGASAKGNGHPTHICMRFDSRIMTRASARRRTRAINSNNHVVCRSTLLGRTHPAEVSVGVFTLVANKR